MVPLYSALEIAVDLTPRLHPETLVYVCLGIVVAIVATQESFYSDGMPEGEHRCIEINLQSALLGIDECLTWSDAHTETKLRGAVFATSIPYVRIVMRVVRVDSLLGEGGVVHSSASLILLSLEADGGLEAPFFLAFKFQFLSVLEHHLVHCSPFPGSEHIVLIRMNELIAWRSDVVR